MVTKNEIFQTYTKPYIAFSNGVSLPRKEYKTISVKVKTFVRFVKDSKNARENDTTMNNTKFLEHLLDLGSGIGTKHLS